jgi:4-carboxymuconolactone decarboxylase
MKPDLTPAAIRNHEALFPGYVSKVKETDPELIEVFDNFAFDEVLRHGHLDVKSRVMVILASTLGSQALSEYTVMLGAALNVGVTPVEAKEILYQAVPYVGIAKVLDFIHATNAVLTARGVTLPLPEQSTTDRQTRRAKGLEIQRRILGDRIDRLYAESPKDLLHIQEFLTANCFGDHVARGGLELRTRELLTLSMLAALGGCESQLAGHVSANLAVGNDRQVLIDVITQLVPYIGYPRALNAVRAVNEATSTPARPPTG